jgi:hypothetical protein
MKITVTVKAATFTCDPKDLTFHEPAREIEGVLIPAETYHGKDALLLFIAALEPSQDPIVSKP